MNETPKIHQPSTVGRFFRRQTQGRALLGLAAIATLVMLFYLEEDWRGRHAWQSSKRELEAKGVVLDWDKYIPPPVPDDQNFFKAPNMADWFQKNAPQITRTPTTFGPSTNELSGLSTNVLTTATISNVTVAATYLKWSDQYQPQFDQIRKALKRPFARMDGDYSQPYNVPIPSFITVRVVAQVLAQRTHCYLLLGEPEKALDELTLLNDSRRLLGGAPTGKPMTLLAAMINVAVTGLYADTIADGFRKHAWQEPQLVSLQKQLREINLIPAVVESFHEMPAHDYRFIEQLRAASKPEKERLNSFLGTANSQTKKWNSPWFLLFNVAPSGWIDQNLVAGVRGYESLLAATDSSETEVYPKKIDAGMRQIVDSLKGYSPFNILARVAIPNYSRALQTTAHNQAMVNEAQIACALERYRLANGVYPETLDALVPQFIEQSPHDIVGDQTLHYRRTDDRKFLLYSVGWNEKDDGGEDSPNMGKPGADYSKGDWVWKN